MLKVTIPKYRFNSADDPGLDPNAEGLVVPERYGTITNIKPVCVDVATGRWRLCRRAIKSIDAIREAGKTLDPAAEYTTDLPNAEFTVGASVQLAGGTNYFFTLESGIAIDGVNYIGYGQQTDGSQYPDGTCYEIDAANNWVDQGTDLQFRVFVKDALDATEYLLVDNMPWGAGWNWNAFLRKTAANTKLGQSFLTPAGGPWYLSRIQLEAAAFGTLDPARITRCTTLTNPGKVQIASKSYRLESYSGVADMAYFPQRGAVSDLQVDIRGIMNADTSLMTNLADIFADVYVEILDGTLAALDPAELAALKAARLEVLALDLSSEMDFEVLVGNLEAGQLWKMIPNNDGTFGFKFAASGEPAGTPHYYDVHVKNFKMRRARSSVYQRVKVKYGLETGTDQSLIAEAESAIAYFFYQSQRLLEVETCLTDVADATALATDYLGTTVAAGRRQHLQTPPVFAEFDLSAGNGWELFPMWKVKLTLARAMSATGSLNGVLFRVLEVGKNPGSGDVHVVSILDSLTY